MITRFKNIMNRKLVRVLSIYLLVLIAIQVSLLLDIGKLSQNKNVGKINNKKQMAENITSEDIEGMTISYPVYTEGDLVYLDPISTDRCDETTFDADKVANGTSTCYKWRVVTTNDSSDKTYVEVQLDHNLGERVNWIDSSDINQIINNSSERTVNNTAAANIGPMGALRILQSYTNNWSRVPLLNYEYDTSNIVYEAPAGQDTNYGKLKCVNGECKNGRNEVLVQNLRARIITPQELQKIAEKNIANVSFGSNNKSLMDWTPLSPDSSDYKYRNDTHTQLDWLMENLHSDSSKGWTTYGLPAASGYWTLSPTGSSIERAWDVSDYGSLYSGISTVMNPSIGIRPIVSYNKLYSAYLVTYNDEGRITKKVVFEGDKAPQIDSKGKQGYDFEYWSLKKDGHSAFDFNNPISKNITLYAVYNKKGCTVVDKTTAVDYIENLYETDDTANNLAYDNTTDNNLRYINSSPKNYIEFNDELWRIIGVFEVENPNGVKEKRLKIVKNTSIGNYSWDTTFHGTEATGAGNFNTANGINEWSQADIMYLLNPNYENHKEPNYYIKDGKVAYDDDYLVNNSLYYNRAAGKCFTSANNYYSDCDFTNTGLKANARKYIDTVKWHTGAVNVSASNITAYDLYNYERGTATGKDGITKTDFPALDNVERTTTWNGQVGLLYASDTIFSAGNCPYPGAPTRQDCYTSAINSAGACTTTNNWLFNGSGPTWSITPTNGLINNNTKSPTFAVALVGTVINSSNTNVSYSYSIKPTLYLKPNVKITEGEGTEANPYKIDFVETPVCSVEVTYNDEGRITTKTISAGSKATSIDSQGKKGYTFKYWSRDKSNEFSFNTKLNDDITLYAMYKVNNYKITYDLDGGTNDPSNPDKYTVEDNKITLKDAKPKDEYHYFVGWTTDKTTEKDLKKDYVIDTSLAKDIKIYAVFQMTKYTVTFDSNGGTKVDSITKNGDELIGTLPTTTRKGYKFEGWYVDGNKIDESFHPRKDITAIAHWTKLKSSKNNPRTSDNIKKYIISLIISTVILEIALKKYIKMKIQG